MLSVLPKLPPLLYLLFFSCLLLNCRSPPSWRPSSILPSHLWLSVRPSPLPFLFASFRLSSLRSGPVEPHTSNSSPVPLTCVAIRCFLDVIPYFSKNFNDWNHQPRGSLSDTTFFFFSSCQPPTPNTMEWQPQQEPLRQLACYLRNSLDGYNRTAQKEAEQVSAFSVPASAHASSYPPPHFDIGLLSRGIMD